MPSYTDEQKRRAVDMVEECGGSVTRAMHKLGYPTRQTLHHWLNRRDASHERKAGRPWSRVLPPSGVVGRDDTRVLPHARRLSEILQRGAAEGEAGMAESNAVPQKSRAGRIAGPKKRPHPRTETNLFCFLHNIRFNLFHLNTFVKNAISYQRYLP